LLALLQLKLGHVSQAVRERVDAADSDTLLRWSERTLTATRIEDVLGANG